MKNKTKSAVGILTEIVLFILISVCVTACAAANSTSVEIETTESEISDKTTNEYIEGIDETTAPEITKIEGSTDSDSVNLVFEYYGGSLPHIYDIYINYYGKKVEIKDETMLWGLSNTPANYEVVLDDMDGDGTKDIIIEHRKDKVYVFEVILVQNDSFIDLGVCPFGNGAITSIDFEGSDTFIANMIDGTVETATLSSEAINVLNAADYVDEDGNITYNNGYSLMRGSAEIVDTDTLPYIETVEYFGFSSSYKTNVSIKTIYTIVNEQYNLVSYEID